MIPLSSKPLEMHDKASGMTYIMKQPTDEVLLDLSDIDKKYQKKTDPRSKLQQINDFIDMVIIGWSCETPLDADRQYNPKVKPSLMLRQNDKFALYRHFFVAAGLMEDELKNS